MKTFAWLLQVLGLIVVGAALGIGLVYEQVRLELTMLVIGGVSFVSGRILGRP